MTPNLKVILKGIFKKMQNPFFALITLILLCSHNLYIKLDKYFLKVNEEATLSLYNGSFEKSENTIARDRILDASLVVNGNRLEIDSSQWTDRETTLTQFNFTPIEEGTYLAGVSTKARTIELTAEKFNKYLEHDGVLDILKERTEKDVLNEDAVESYEKHVKAIYQVGDLRTNDWSTELGYPIEFIPESNPYEKYTGEQLDVKLLLNGKPLENQLVYVDYVKVIHNHDHGHEHHKHEDEHEHESHNHEDHKHDTKGEHEHSHDDHAHENHQQLRTNERGIVSVNLPEDGIYYLRTIQMTTVSDSDELTHTSKWATLTFEVTHSHDTHEHHDHNHKDGIPTWVFVLGSVLVVGLLFLIFRKKN